MTVEVSYESVAVSTRIRLARNFQNFAFPAILLKDAHATEKVREIARLIESQLASIDVFRSYRMVGITDVLTAYLLERGLISRDLIRHRDISLVYVNRAENISVMINEEDHIREQSFMKGYELRRAYEQISGVDEKINETVPYAFDPALGFLTACPTNLGTGLRASVMLFLPAIARHGFMPAVKKKLRSEGLTVRGTRGEGSDAEGDLFQISNEVTLGFSEAEIIDSVENMVKEITKFEIRERERMKAESGSEIEDGSYRAYSLLKEKSSLKEDDFLRLLTDLKLGIALGFMDGIDVGESLFALDELRVDMRPANINKLHRVVLSPAEQDAFRAEHVRDSLENLFEKV